MLTDNSLQLRLDADTARFVRDMRNAEQMVSQSMRGIGSAAEAASKGIAGASAAASGMGDAIGVQTRRASRHVADMQKSVGVSAGQTAMAMRMLPAQFSDVATQLAGGQSPFLVLLQQGLQTRDMFGGFGAMFRGIAATITPASVAIGGLVGGIGTLGFAFVRGQREADAMARSLHLTRNAAGLTIGGFRSLGDEIAMATGATIGMSRESAALAVSMGMGSAATREVANAIAVYARAADIGTDKAAALFSGVGKDALRWAVDMSEKTNFLTLKTYAHIKALQDQGRNQEAAAVAAKALAERLAENPPQLGYIEQALQSATAAWSKFWDAALDVGRPDTVEDRLNAAKKRLAELQAIQKGGQLYAAGLLPGRSLQGDIGQAQADIQRLTAARAFDEQIAKQDAARVSQEKARVAAARYTDEMQKSISPMSERSRRLAELDRHVKALAGTEQAWSAAMVERARAEIMAQTQDTRGVADAQAAADLRLAVKKAGVEAELRLIEGRNTALEVLRSQDMISERDAASEATRIAVDRAMAQQRLLEAQRQAIQSRPVTDAASATRRNADLVAIESQIKDAAAAVERAWVQGTANVGKLDLTESRGVMQQWAADYERLAKEAERMSEEIGAASVSMIKDPAEQARAQAELSVRKIRKDTAEIVRQAKLQIEILRGLGNGVQAEALSQKVSDIERMALDRQAQERMKVEVDIARKAADEWQKSADKIGDALTDALMRGFEGGKDAAANMRDVVVNMFKSMVLRPMVQAVVQPFAQQAAGYVGQMFGMPSGGGAVGMLGNAGSLFNAGSAAAGIFGSSAAYGAALGTTSIGAGSQAAMLAAQTGVFGAEGAAMTAAAAGNAGTAGLLSGAGAVVPYVAAAIAIAAIAKSLDDSGTLHAGYSSRYDAASGVTPWSGAGSFVGHAQISQDTASFTDAIAQGVGQMLDATAQTFGKTAGYEVATAFADDTSKDGAWGSLIVKLGEKSVVDWRDTQTSRWAPKEFADGQQGREQFVSAVSADVRRALEAIGLPTWAQRMLDQLGESPSIEQLSAVVQNINAAQSALKSLSDVLPQLASMSDQAKMALINASGGIQALASNLNDYETRILSSDEQTALKMSRVTEQFKLLGVQMPTSKAGFKALVDSIDTTTDSGSALLARVLSLSGAFADVYDTTGGLTTAMQDLGLGLQNEIDRIRGLLGTGGGGASGMAYLQAQFATLTAQARAGDQTAIGQLPEASRALLEAAGQQASSRIELVRLQAQTMRSLEDTQSIVRGVAPIVGQAESGAVTGSSSAAVASSASASTEMLDELKSLRLEVVSLRSEVEGLRSESAANGEAIAGNTSKTAKLLDRAMPDGDAFATRDVSSVEILSALRRLINDDGTAVRTEAAA